MLSCTTARMAGSRNLGWIRYLSITLNVERLSGLIVAYSSRPLGRSCRLCCCSRDTSTCLNTSAASSTLPRLADAATPAIVGRAATARAVGRGTPAGPRRRAFCTADFSSARIPAVLSRAVWSFLALETEVAIPMRRRPEDRNWFSTTDRKLMYSSALAYAASRSIPSRYSSTSVWARLAEIPCIWASSMVSAHHHSGYTIRTRMWWSSRRDNRKDIPRQITFCLNLCMDNRSS
mmetsp:Transcript_28422/g.64494  ORF Transcript_28422/g.64494 Transcript_28422/m.64494 type:complete len:234 (-) Transcript_28422:19-720(-)